ncbi:alpha-keto acid decarboxylase family protein [Thermoactinomyces sp. CICC 10522]|uniref:alpha-keto acid decarboxylase family protein n=1 Tax=Thermoactinomyces sp. CICC 10522 TaxID=2767427 RepID=UPI0018DCEA4A|nr:alpha-keto acid decarboxylase family protein [Thermoactinomyces sp. CICC 10522]MBH8605203.1 alpha-keto acid decarboxylase family protein [Thermoactinomyces sp. CICC 10522]
MSKKITVGDYLLLRLKEMGVRHVFGVPGDYNLGFLDQIANMEGLEWIGNCNELNAAYAADGYARVNGIAALVTTFGVGELSAINGIAGSYAEQVPVVKITGTPSTKVMKKGALVHHTLGDGDFTHFMNMFKEVTVAQTMLTEENAAEEIDRVLRECWLQKRPVHINIPADISYKEIDAPQTSLALPEPVSDPTQLNKFVQKAAEELNKANSPFILADYEVNRYRLYDQLRTFVEASGYPIASFSMGKGVIDETHPQFIGVHTGQLSEDFLKQCIQESDCFILIGVKLTDSITGGFRFIHDLEKTNIIEIHPSYARINNEVFQAVSMREALEQLTEHVQHRTWNLNPRPAGNGSPFIPSSESITQERFWQRLASFFKPGDVLLAEQGTSFFAASTVKLPEKTTFVGQPLWGSIGYTLPALLGTQLADQNRRNILVIGDGSFQLTAQELSTILLHDLKPIIFLINNDGYTVERMIHGAEQRYNDINRWNYRRIPDVLDLNGNSISFQIKTEEELEEVLSKAEKANKLVFIEVHMGRLDSPALLRELGKLFAEQNKYC